MTPRLMPKRVCQVGDFVKMEAWSVRALRWSLGPLSVLWAASLPVAAHAASDAPGVLTYPFALVVYAIGSLVCHQRPDRSFHLHGVPLPVCARCVGIYVGAAIASLGQALFAFQQKRIPLRHAFKRAAVPPTARLLAASAPTVATLVYEWTTGVTPSNWLRAAAALPVGFVVMQMLVRSLAEPGSSTRDARPDLMTTGR